MAKKLTIELEVDEHGAFDGAQLKKQGVVCYDQPLLATATARSAITYIDGDAGILRYRGYPIEQLAEQKHFLEVAYLLAHGELRPTRSGRRSARRSTTRRSTSRRIAALVESFPVGSHPMAILIAGLRGARRVASGDEGRQGRRDAAPRSSRSCSRRRSSSARTRSPGMPASSRVRREGDTYARRFIAACGDAVDTSRGEEALDVFGRALDVLFVLHADHELNAGTNAMRAIGSAETDMYSSLAGAAAALYGPLHGGANEAVLRMLADDRLGRARRRTTSSA